MVRKLKNSVLFSTFASIYTTFARIFTVVRKKIYNFAPRKKFIQTSNVYFLGKENPIATAFIIITSVLIFNSDVVF